MAYHIDTIIARKILNSPLSKGAHGYYNIGHRHLIEKLEAAAEQDESRDKNEWIVWSIDYYSPISEGRNIDCRVTFERSRSGKVLACVGTNKCPPIPGEKAIEHIEFVRRVAQFCQEMNAEFALLEESDVIYTVDCD